MEKKSRDCATRVAASAAGHRHRPRQMRPLLPADDEVMALWLPGDGRVDRGVEEGVVATCAKRRSEIGCVLLAETHIESAGAGDAYAIARFAEIMRQRRDEAEPPPSLAHLDIAGRTAGAVVV